MELRVSSKELKRVLEAAEKVGWRFEYRSKHIVGKHIDGVQITTIGRSPSDHRAIHNIKRYLGLKGKI